MSLTTRHIALINVAHTFTHYSLLVLPTAVLAMTAPGGAFGEAYGPILALATGMFVLYGAFSLPQGWIAQRVGRPTLITVFFLGTGLSMVATAFSRPGYLQRSTTRSEPQCWSMPQATDRVAPSASTACSAMSASDARQS
jgi:hypothetical protein